MQPIEHNRFKIFLEEGYGVVDTRSSEIFCEGFIEESISIPFDENFVDTFQELTEPGQKFLLVADENKIAELDKIIRASIIDNVEGYLKGGFNAWQTEGNKVDLLITIEADEFKMDYQYDEFILVDVRSKEEFAKQHAEDAENIALNDLEQILIEFETTESHYVYGNTASEAITAGSIFKKIGFQRIRVVAADFATIKATGIPFFVQKKKENPSSRFSNN